MKTKIIISIIVLITAFAFGRYTVPEKTTSKDIYKESSSKTTEKDKETHKKTIITETTKPDGTKEKTTTVTEDSENHKTTDSTKTSDKEKETETIRGDSKVTVSMLGGVGLSNPSEFLVGVAVSKPILGPVTVGLWGLNKYGTTNFNGGASLGLTF